MDKQSLRREILSIRDRLGKEEKGRMDEALHHKLLSLELALGGPPVYLYLSFGSEIDTWGILKELTSRNIPVAAPRVRGKEMAFFKICGPEDLKPGLSLLAPLWSRRGRNWWWFRGRSLTERATGSAMGADIMTGIWRPAGRFLLIRWP